MDAFDNPSTCLVFVLMFVYVWPHKSVYSSLIGCKNSKHREPDILSGAEMSQAYSHIYTFRRGEIIFYVFWIPVIDGEVMSRTGFHNGRERGCCHSDAGQGEGLGVSVEVSDGARCFDLVFWGGPRRGLHQVIRRPQVCIRIFPRRSRTDSSFVSPSIGMFITYRNAAHVHLIRSPLLY